MADIELTCTGCGQVLEAPEDMAGETVECPECGTQLVVPAIAASAGALKLAGQKCPSCGVDMAADAVLCIHCGFHIKLGKKIDTQL